MDLPNSPLSALIGTPPALWSLLLASGFVSASRCPEPVAIDSISSKAQTAYGLKLGLNPRAPAIVTDSFPFGGPTGGDDRGVDSAFVPFVENVSLL